MALKYKEAEPTPEGMLAVGSYLAESAQLKDYLRQMLAEYQPYLTPLAQLRKELARQLKGQSLSELVRQMREESAH
ncbi:hypothetical protein LM602_08505 [Candidatus Acetothermia bacterium]|jgi:hypothetical protein|nr:hypothetical protein [Candidatus Acetothermia bacterium]MCI2432565.1 hypothetical protein [Candidatus Acetothermia bacterium]MCI2435858.1 hypothetical protein [Candidatus Acetothermia bacterium]